SNRLLVATADGFWQLNQTELTGPYVSRYFEEIDAQAGRRTEQLRVALAHSAYPRFAVEPATLAAAEARLARDDLHPAVRRTMVDDTDDLRRALAIRTAAAREAR